MGHLGGMEVGENEVGVQCMKEELEQDGSASKSFCRACLWI